MRTTVSLAASATACAACATAFALAIAVGGLATPVAAESVTILNPGFELPDMAECGATIAIPGWLNGGAWNPGNDCGGFPGFHEPVPEGDQCGYAHAIGFPAQQQLTATLQPNTTYTLTVEVGRRFEPCCPMNEYRIMFGTQGPAQAPNELAVDANSHNPAAGTFTTSQLTYTTGDSHAWLGQPLVIHLSLVSGVQAMFDNVRLTAVPAGGNAIPGDMDLDGDVDGADLGALLGGWGTCATCNQCPGDIDGDCDVDGADLGVLLANWGS